MSILITGAGLIGTAFAAQAVARGETVIFFDSQPRESYLEIRMGPGTRYEVVRADVRDLDAVTGALHRYGVEVVVHTAGLIGKRVSDSLHTAFDVNLRGTANLAEAVQRTGVRRLVHVSSAGVYDWRQVGDDAIDENFPRGSGGAYASFNIAREIVLETYAARHHFELVLLRPARIFGLGHFWSGSGGGKRIQDWIVTALSGQEIELRSDSVKDDYLYAKDLAAAIDRATVVALPSPSFINLGSGRLTSNAAVIDIIVTLIPRVAVKRTADGDEGGRPAPLDISAAQRLLGWQPRYSLEAALADYIGEVRALGVDRLERLRH